MKPDKLLTTGIPSRQQIESATPPESRRKQGAFVVIECFQEIPCDPCYHSCRFGAIKPFGSLNDIPQVDWDKCTGCGVCVAACPGLAIFVVDETLSDTQCLIAMPYEFLPLPQKGDPVYLLDRSGNKLGPGGCLQGGSGQEAPRHARGVGECSQTAVHGGTESPAYGRSP